MIAFEANNSSKVLRILAVAGMFAGYAFVAYHLSSLPNQWIGVLIVLMIGVIGLVFIRDRHLALLSALALAIPLVGFDFSLYFNPKLGGDYRVAASLLDFTLLGLWFHYMFSVPREQRRALQPNFLKWMMASLFLLAVLSVNFAEKPALTFFEMIRLTRMMVLATILAKCVNSESALQRVVLVLLTITMAEGALGFAQKLSGGQLGINLLGEPDKVMTQELNTGDTAIRVGGTFGHANQFARFLGLVLPLALAVVIAAQHKTLRVLAAATLIMGGGALVATLSRAAWIGVTVGSGLVFTAMILRPALRPRALQSLKTILLLIIPFVLINLGTFIARFTSQDEGSFATREPMARIALKIIQDYPLGVGYGNYRVVLPRYGDPAVPFTLQAKVHNMYLLIAAELGIISLIVFSGILLAVLVQGLRLAKRTPPDLGMVAIGIAGGLVAFAIHGLVDYEEIGRIPILWFYFGLIGAITQLQSRTEPAPAAVDQKNLAQPYKFNGV